MLAAWLGKSGIDLVEEICEFTCLLLCRNWCGVTLTTATMSNIFSCFIHGQESMACMDGGYSQDENFQCEDFDC